ncbi:hypothetical protein CDAR_563861 [Caerostris darwini]|uniref:LAGLIDADG homing endonuclease n=1 Tax=Caerostris darwini TaxID=1538125 RepID=A0AAV4UZP3_9ARAC|nr:hypothetical protein CDAR_563861 [Caerostris darwini]
MQAVTFNTPNYQQSVDLGKGLGGEGCIIKSPFSHHYRIAGSFGNDDFLCKRFGNVSKCRRGFPVRKIVSFFFKCELQVVEEKKGGMFENIRMFLSHTPLFGYKVRVYRMRVRLSHFGMGCK